MDVEHKICSDKGRVGETDHHIIMIFIIKINLNVFTITLIPFNKAVCDIIIVILACRL